MSKANVIEIFHSIQGEGKYIGYSQIFIRLAGCNLNCDYCDTNISIPKLCCIETKAGLKNFFYESNPLEAQQVFKMIKNFFNLSFVHSISFTGGEPLLHWKFISEFSQYLKNTQTKIFLETNGTLAEELKNVLDDVDIVSMDLKLPSNIGKDVFELHRSFFKIACKKDLYVKIVVTSKTTLEEFLLAIDLIAEIDPEILLVIQPVTPVNGIRSASIEKIFDLQTVALSKIKNVRVIPQTHVLLGIL